MESRFWAFLHAVHYIFFAYSSTPLRMTKKDVAPIVNATTNPKLIYGKN